MLVVPKAIWCNELRERMDTDKNLLHDLGLRYSHKCSWYLKIMEREVVATLVLLVLTARVLVRVCPT